MPDQSRFLLAGIALAAAGVLTACSGATTPAIGAASPVATESAGTQSAANATESNPPGDIPDNQVFVDYSPTKGGYTVRVPEGWARTEGTDNGTTTLFTDKYNSIKIGSNPSPAAPTVQSGQAEVNEIGSAAMGFRPGEVTVVQRPAGEAVLITYQADSQRNEVTGKVVSDAVERYEFWKNGTTIVLTLSGPKGADNVDPWRTVTESFGWTDQ